MPTYKEATPSPLRSGQVVYDVWVMTELQRNKRIASKPTLRKAYEVITPEHREQYVYILKWTPAVSVASEASEVFGSQDRFGPLQGQHRTPEPSPTSEHLWGCLCGRVHTEDLRESVRKILRSG